MNNPLLKSVDIELEELTNKLSLANLVASSVVKKTHLHKEINEVYEKKKVAYKDAYSQLNIPDGERILQPFGLYNCHKQMVSIISWSIDNNDFTEVMPIIRKTQKPVWDFVKQEGYFSIRDFVEAFSNSSRVINIADNIPLGLFLGLYKGELREEEQITLPEFLAFNLQDRMFTTKLFVESLKPSEKHVPTKTNKLLFKSLTTSNTLEEGIFSYKEKIRKKPSSVIPTSVLSEKVIRQKVDYVQNEENTFESLFESEDIMPSVHEDDFMKILAKWSFIFFKLGVNVYRYLTFVEVDKKKLRFYLELINELTDREAMTSENKKDVTAVALLLFPIIYESRDLREIVESDKDDSLQESFENMKDDFEKELQDYKKKLNDSLSNTKMLTKEINKLSEEKRLLEKQLRNHERAVSAEQELSILRKENAALKKFVNSRMADNSNTTEVDIEKISSHLNKHKIAIVGGHHKWQQKVKSTYLPGVVVLHVDEINKDFNVLNTADYIFLSDSVLNHGFYYKFKNWINKNNKDFFYLQNAVNPEKTIREMDTLIRS